ncbi:MAG: protein kinase domain-containing protein [Planctomyces sp.]
MSLESSRAAVIDEAIELFERSWRVDHRSLIEEIVSESQLSGDPELLAELIRVDIDRRYAVGAELSVGDYFERFPVIRQYESHVAAICFEDYRERRSRRRSCPPSRWSGFAGVESQGWYRELLSQTQMARSSAVQGEFPSTASFVSVQVEHVGGEFVAGGDAAAVESKAERIGDFELMSLLGEGAFSRVYLARQLSLGRRYVAVKVVDRPMQEQFHLARLQHTGIVPLYSCHEVQGRWVLCMPYSGATTVARWLREVREPAERTGGSLNGVVRRAQEKLTRLPAGSSVAGTDTDSLLTETPVAGDVLKSLRRWHEAASGPLQQLVKMDAGNLALWIFRRLASALTHAHQRGMVHGDLKPANILIRNDGEPALIDFNLSQHTENRERVWVGGTLPYLSCEQLRQLLGKTPGAARPEFDVHSLGVIMFEILEGRLPFRAPASTAVEELEASIASHASPPVFTSGVGSIGLRTIVAACLSPGVAQIYPTAAELLADLEREAASLPLLHASESFWKGTVPKFVRRYPRAISSGVVCTISALIIGGLMMGLVSSREKNERLRAMEALEELRFLSDYAFSTVAVPDLAVDAFQSVTSESIALQCMKALGAETPDEMLDSWDWMSGKLDLENRREAEDRLRALGFVVEQLEQKSADSGPSSEKDVVDSFRRTVSSLAPSRSSTTVGGSGEVPREKARALEVGSHAQIVAALEGTGPVDRLFAASLMLTRGRPDAAMAILDATTVPGAFWSVYWVIRGRSHFDMQQYREAIAAFSSALSSSEQSVAARYSRGLALMYDGQLLNAEQDFSKLIENNPQLPEAWAQRAMVRQSLRKYDDAVADLDEALKLRPDGSRLRLMRGRLLTTLKKEQQAEADFSYAMQHQPTTALDWISRAISLFDRKPEDGLRDLQQAEKLYGPNPLILQPMAHVLSERLNRPDESIQVLDRLLGSSPRYQKALSGRAVLHARAGRWELAQQDVDTLLAMPERRGNDINYQIACVYALMSQKHPELAQEAISWLARAVAGGYGRDIIDTDTDLQPIRGMQDFQMIRRTARILSQQKDQR